MKSKEQKRFEAKVRQEAYDKLSSEEKFNLASSRPGNSRKERARLVMGEIVRRKGEK